MESSGIPLQAIGVPSIEQINQQIAAAVKQQSVIADAVSQNMAQVREVAEDSAREACSCKAQRLSCSGLAAS
jgi:methyl-accepting chemotaxis protein